MQQIEKRRGKSKYFVGIANQVEPGFAITPCIFPNLANSRHATVFKTKRQPSFSCPHQLSSKKITENQLSQ